MATGRVAIFTFPSAACTVVGNEDFAAPAGADPIGPAGTMLATTGAASEANKTAMVAVARLMLLNMIILHRLRRTKCARSDSRWGPNEPPFLRGLVTSTQVRRLGSPPQLQGASPLRDSAGIRPDFAESVSPRHPAGAASTVAHNQG